MDQHGFVVDILVQSRRDQHAAEAFIRRAVEGWDYTPRVVITDKLASYPPTVRRVLPTVEHRRHKGLNVDGPEILPVGGHETPRWRP